MLRKPTRSGRLNGLAMISSSRLASHQVGSSEPRAFRSRKCSESRPPEVANHGAATKNIARSPDRGHEKDKRGRNRAGTTRKDREEVEGSLHGVARVLQAALHLQLQEAVLLPGCADGGHVPGSSSPRPSIRTWIRAAKQTEIETRGKARDLKRKVSKRALTQRKARAREEPSPGPPASETDAGPPGHQSRGGAPARPRLSRGQEGPT